MITLETQQQQNPLWTLPLNTCGAASCSFFIFSCLFSHYYFMSYGQIESCVYHQVRRVYAICRLKKELPDPSHV